MRFIATLQNLISDIYCGTYVKKHPLLGYVTLNSDATMEHETLCQRSNSYSRNNRTVRSGVFCTDRVLSNTIYIMKESRRLFIPETSCFPIEISCIGLVSANFRDFKVVPVFN
jgi:hypothetical protein